MTARKHHTTANRGSHHARIRRRAFPKTNAREGAKYGVRGNIQHKVEEKGGKK